MNPRIRRLVLAYSARSRRRKADRIVELMHRIGARRILLVGGMASGTEPNEGIVERIVGAHAVEVVSINLYDPGPQPWPYVVADGCLMPFQDRSFDLVVSNAVIEHVGDETAQREFVREHLRVGHAWVMTTPNRWFPVESHTSMLFRHWSPSWRGERTEFTRLLSRREFKAVLPPGAALIGRPWQPTFLGHSSLVQAKDQPPM